MQSGRHSTGRRTSARPKTTRPQGKAAPARSHRTLVVALLGLFAGVLCIAYPFVSDYLHQRIEGGVIETQRETVSNTDEDLLARERQRAIEYNEQLLGSRTVVTDPFDPNALKPTSEEYEQVMNLAGDGVMGTISIPKIHVEMPVYHGTAEDTLQRGVGHLEQTSVPIGGESTHSVLSGHTGLPSMKIFDNLDQLEVGDYFVLSVLGEDHAYRVTAIEVVLPDQTESLVIQPGKDLCTLVTCTPYGINSHRLLVHAERCEVPEEWLNKGDAEFPSGYSEPTDKALLPSVLLGLALAAIIIGLYALVAKLRAKRGRGSRANFDAAVPMPSATGGKHFRQPGVSARPSSQGAVGVRPVVPGRHRRGRRHG